MKGTHVGREGLETGIWNGIASHLVAQHSMQPTPFLLKIWGFLVARRQAGHGQRLGTAWGAPGTSQGSTALSNIYLAV